MKPVCYDLFCGLGGYSEAFIAEGYKCVGFDIERHDYGTGGYPGELRIRDARSIHGSELKDAVCIVASPPCTEYSYMAMPWKRAKQIEKALTGRADFPEGYMGSRTIEQLNELFNTCFRIQREAIEAAGHHIPLIVENVRGAQKWVGRARWNYGSFYLWGDVPALMPVTLRPHIKAGHPERSYRKGHVSTAHLTNRAEHGLKVSMNFHEHEKTGKPGRSFQSAAVAQYQPEAGLKMGGDWFSDPTSTCRRHGSKSNARKAASAMIAKIPEPLARHIAKVYYPRDDK